MSPSKFALSLVALSLTGCVMQPVVFHDRHAIAKNFHNELYNGQRVEVLSYGYEWIKGGNTLKVYRVRTSDGKIFAAQQFQLGEL